MQRTVLDVMLESRTRNYDDKLERFKLITSPTPGDIDAIMNEKKSLCKFIGHLREYMSKMFLLLDDLEMVVHEPLNTPAPKEPDYHQNFLDACGWTDEDEENFYESL